MKNNLAERSGVSLTLDGVFIKPTFGSE